MSWIDWLIVIVPMAFILYMGYFTLRFIKGVVDFLSAGRLARRYIISVGDIANALSIMGLVAYVEIHYKTGFALPFWNHMLLPLGIFMALSGYCTYRFRETKAMSLGQFIEMRYSRKLRIFASGLRSLSEMLANMIMPAIAARFFIYFFDLPLKVQIFGFSIPTFQLIVLVCLSMAIFLICTGGTLSLLITDGLQGMVCYPLMALFVIFIFSKFSWSNEIIPVMMDRVPGESFLNPYDISKLRDFNLFFIVLSVFVSIIHRGSWLGAGGSSSAVSAHEQKMSGLLGTWRFALNNILYVIIAVSILTLLNHKNFAPEAKHIRVQLASQAAKDVFPDEALRQEFVSKIESMPLNSHTIGIDPPLSEKANLDTRYLDAAHETLQKTKSGNQLFQEFRTLYHQGMLAVTIRNMLPTGLLGLFCLLMVMAMVSTDDTRIYSAALTITQDCVIPFWKKGFTQRQHIWAIRLVSIGVGVFFFFGSSFMSQLDYINLFITLMCTLWQAGCGPLVLFGLYSRFGTTAGAWASLLSGVFLALLGIGIQRNWADLVYPWLENRGWVEGVGAFLETVSRPFNPYVVWEMNPVKFPINSYEMYFMMMLVTLVIYIAVSYLTCREPFNLDRMLHRGKYNLDGEKKGKTEWSLKTVFSKLLGITPEYTTGDKFIAWSFFIYSFIYTLFGCFLMVVVWNFFSPWKLQWWGNYFFIVFLAVPAVLAVISTFWFGIGGVRDFYRLFYDLKHREVNPLDNGVVDGHLSLADKEQLEALDQSVKNESGE